MRTQRWLRLIVGALALIGCERSSVVMTGPAVDELWLGPDVVASPEEITSLADLTIDPVVLDVTSQSKDGVVAEALESFGAGILIDPAPSFLSFELTLGSVYGGTPPSPSLEIDPDAELVREVLDLYRDHAAMTLFGVERDALSPFTQPNGS